MITVTNRRSPMTREELEAILKKPTPGHSVTRDTHGVLQKNAELLNVSRHPFRRTVHSAKHQFGKSL